MILETTKSIPNPIQTRRTPVVQGAAAFSKGIAGLAIDLGIFESTYDQRVDGSK